MKITYKDNPLESTIELDESEQRELWLKIKIQELEYLLECAYFESNKEDFDISCIRKEVDMDYWESTAVGQKSKIDLRVDEIFNYHLDDLTSSHAGDCTCYPCSCCKCHAERLLGIDTIKGLSKHKASYILSAFKEFNTIDGVINSLENYIPDRAKYGWSRVSDKQWDTHALAAVECAKHAGEWLKQYKQNYLNALN
jgi:hypothetical protein